MDYDMYGGILTFPDRAGAEAAVRVLDGAVYVLSYGEYARPDYLVRKLRGRDAWGIRIRYWYQPGAVRVHQDGWMCVAQAWHMGILPAPGARS